MRSVAIPHSSSQEQLAQPKYLYLWGKKTSHGWLHIHTKDRGLVNEQPHLSASTPSVIKALCFFSLGIQVQQSRASMDLTHYDGLFISRKHCQGLSKKSGCIAEECLRHLWMSSREHWNGGLWEMGMEGRFTQGNVVSWIRKSVNLKIAWVDLSFSILTNTGGL